jgi:hypothetical protein
MYLMYVDESGDTGLVSSQTRYFALSGLVVHELRWALYLDALIQFRRKLKVTHGLLMHDEFHSAHFLTRPGSLVRIPRYERLAMIRAFADTLAGLTDLNVINVIVDKQGKPPGYDVFEWAWKVLIQRFENTISHHNFPGPRNPDERGILICDHTDKRLVKLLRKMRRFNMVPSQFWPASSARSLPLQYMVEDATFRDSATTYFIQAADLAAYLLYQFFAPNKYVRSKAAHRYFLRLSPVLCRVASLTHPQGIVRL